MAAARTGLLWSRLRDGQGNIPVLWVRILPGASWPVRLGAVCRGRRFGVAFWRCAEGDGAGILLPAFDLVPVLLRSAFQPAVPAGDPGFSSPAAEFGAAAAEDAGQFRHENTSPW